MKTLCSLVLIAFTLGVNAQTLGWEWMRTGNDAYLNQVVGTAVDASGNVYSIGEYKSNLTIGTTLLANASTSYEDVFVVKYNISGVLQWARKIGGTGVDKAAGISIDTSGNCLVYGYYTATSLIIDSYTLTNTSVGTQELFLAKLDGTTGTAIWARDAGSGGDDRAVGITTDNNGNVILTGTFNGPSITFDAFTANMAFGCYNATFLTKLDNNGNALWLREYGDTAFTNAGKVVCDLAGNIYMNGWFEGYYYSMDAFTAIGFGDMYVAKINGSGAVQWMNTPSFQNWGDQINDILIDESGDLYVAGQFTGDSIVMGSITVYNNEVPYSDVFLVKMDASGNYLWGENFWSFASYDEYPQLALGSPGNIYISMQMSGSSVTLGSSTYTGVGSYDTYICRVNSMGVPVWSIQLGGAGYEGQADIAYTTNTLYVGSYTTSAPLNFNSALLSSDGNSDYFVAKLGIGTDVTENDATENTCIAFPNPTADILNISSKQLIEQIRIRDITGKIVFTKQVNQTQVTLNLQNLVNGLYVLEAYTEKGEIYTKKITRY